MCDEYLQAVEANCEGLDGVFPGVCSICFECQSDFNIENETEFKERISSGEICDEGSFSSSCCDSCGSAYAGKRYTAHAWTSEAREKGFPIGELIHLEICSDCLQFHANGETPQNWIDAKNWME